MDAIWQRRKVEASNYFENLMNKLQELEEVFHRCTHKEQPKLNDDQYFCDGRRKIDFVFVFKRNSKPKVKETVNAYIRNLQREGVHFEIGESRLHPDLLFIKVHVARSRLIMCSVLINYEPAFMRVPDLPLAENRIINLPFMYTELTRLDVFSEIVQRASESSLGAKPKDLTSAERIMITYELLKNVQFGTKNYEMGLNHLVDNKFLVAAFPLHEQPSLWTQTGPLNDRQLLMRFWASYTMIFKYQPLDLIHKYYGPEVAFYFAFLGFYNRMLIPVAILGVFSVAYGLITYNTFEKNPFSKSYCSSNQVFCPNCPDKRICGFRAVIDECHNSRLHYIVDNGFTLIYAIVMCFWATTVTELWKRQEAILRYKWNLLTVERDVCARPEYTRVATHQRVNKYTRITEYFIPQKVRMLKLCASYICCGFLAAIVMLGVISTIMLRLSIVYVFNLREQNMVARNISAVSHLLSTSALLVFMMIFDNIYKYVAKKLTDFETPRTQSAYDHSYIFKVHLLSVINAYAYLYYTVFFKGAYKTYPGDSKQYESAFGVFNNDVEESMGGMRPLSIQLMVIFTAKALFIMSWQILKPLIIIIFRKRHAEKRLQNKQHVYSSWEKGYHRKRTGYYDVTLPEFKSIIIQYGYLILFPSAFPIGPLFAFVTNMLEMRVDAYKLTRWLRRPIPIRVPGIGAWNSILNVLSYIGIITNCFIIAFATNFIFYMEWFLYDEEINLLNATFSVFATKDYPAWSDFYGTQGVDFCLYKGRRFPPDHARRYQHNENYWWTLSNQLLVVIVLEALVLGFNKLLSYAIPDMPCAIKERIRVRRQRENAAREKRLNEHFRANQRASDSREEIAELLQQMQRNV